MPIAQGLGFLSPEQISDSPYKFNSPYTMVRFRDGWSEVLDFAPDVSGRHPRIGITFFVRRGLEPRGGSYGVAIAPQPKRSFLELFSRRKEPTAEEAVAQAAAEAGELLHIVDRHLKDGTSHPRLRPAVYYDEPAR